MSTDQKGILYLVPMPIAEESEWRISPTILDIIKNANVILCERIRTTRRHIKPHLSQEEFDRLEFYEMDKHNRAQEPDEVLHAL